jgi:predicted nucleic acid-binding protein
MRDEEAFITNKLLSRFVNFSLEPDIADRAGQLIAQRKAQNQSLAVPDAIIAATAVRHQLTLVTLNRRDFEAVPGVRLYPIDS